MSQTLVFCVTMISKRIITCSLSVCILQLSDCTSLLRFAPIRIQTFTQLHLGSCKTQASAFLKPLSCLNFSCNQQSILYGGRGTQGSLQLPHHRKLFVLLLTTWFETDYSPFRLSHLLPALFFNFNSLVLGLLEFFLGVVVVSISVVISCRCHIVIS